MLAGALDGALATAAMSAVMAGAQRAGWLGEMPPRRIARLAVLPARGHATPRRAKDALGALAHVGFGAAAGSLFEALRRGPARRRRVGPLLGAAFGAGVWLVSYAGWIPALGVLPPPHRDRADRQTWMLVAHLVYGGVLGLLADRRAPARRPDLAAEGIRYPSIAVTRG